MKTIAIMQPTYLPWIGYFGMIDRVDVFVFLDTVQFARRSWQQRNQIKTANGPQLLTVPVLKRGARDQKISEVRIDQEARFAEKHIRSIERSLSRAPYFKENAEPLFAILRAGHTKLSDLNITLIEWLTTALGISCEFSRSSQLEAEGSKADLLANICKKLEGDIYLAAPGSRDYIEESRSFQDCRIKVVYHHFEHPVYAQLHPPFGPYMSSIDLLFNMGPQSLERIRSGYREELSSAS